MTTPRPPSLGQRPSRDAGQAAVEFAMVFPLVIIAALAALQIGLVVRDQLAVGLAAREAARAASVTTDLATAADRAERASGVDGIEVTIVENDDTVVATATKHGATALPLLGALVSGVQLRASSTMLIEPPP